jgi:hypothetical protein
MRSADLVRKCLLFGVDRTHRGHHETDAFDPQRTWQGHLLDQLVGAGEALNGLQPKYGFTGNQENVSVEFIPRGLLECRLKPGEVT